MSGAPTNSKGPLSGRLIVLGITGSIAAFKAPEIVRALRAAGAAVASASSLDLHRYVEYPDPRGGASLARVEPTAALANLKVS